MVRRVSVSLGVPRRLRKAEATAAEALWSISEAGKLNPSAGLEEVDGTRSLCDKDGNPIEAVCFHTEEDMSRCGTYNSWQGTFQDGQGVLSGKWCVLLQSPHRRKAAWGS